ncbi:MAG: transporter substrate-binding domain-containing protein [Pseudoruegeria sp.]
MYVKSFFVVCTLLFGALPQTGVAQNLSCGSTYVIQEGDTISNIAKRTYGSAAAQALIVIANPTKLRNIDIIFAGTKIELPCIKVSGRAVNQTGERQSDIRWRGADIAMLTGSDYAPFSDRGYEGGGMVTAIARRAAELGAPEASVSVSWVNDWGAHLQTLLLERRAFDVGFPWYRPNCRDRSALDANAILRCDNFHFSKPVYESILPFFSATSDEKEYLSLSDMEGARICRPDGFLTFDLVEKGLLAADHFEGGESKVVLLQPATPEDCFEMVLSGDADLASVNSLTAQATLNNMNAAPDFVSHDRVASIVAHHIVVPKNRPEGAALMRRLDNGLSEMEESGELDELRTKYVQMFFSEN